MRPILSFLRDSILHNGLMLLHMLPFLLGIILFASAASAQKQTITRGNDFFQKKEYAKALEMYNKSRSQNDSRTQYNQGTTLLRLYQPKEAMKALEKATEQEKNPWYKSQGYHNEGVIFQAQRQYDLAIECYKNALRNNPHDEHARYNLALCKRLKEEEDKNEGSSQTSSTAPHEMDQSTENESTEKRAKESPISSENADQLLNISKQAEQKTQNKVKSKQIKPETKNLEKNW